MTLWVPCFSPLCGGNTVLQTGKGLLALDESVRRTNCSHVLASPRKSCLCPMVFEPHRGEDQVEGGYYSPPHSCGSSGTEKRRDFFKAHGWQERILLMMS